MSKARMYFKSFFDPATFAFSHTPACWPLATVRRQWPALPEDPCERTLSLDRERWLTRQAGLRAVKPSRPDMPWWPVPSVISAS